MVNFESVLSSKGNDSMAEVENVSDSDSDEILINDSVEEWIKTV